MGALRSASTGLFSLAAFGLGSPPCLAVTTYVSTAGHHVITIGWRAMTIDGVRYPLVDCADEALFCLKGGPGFHASFPKTCPDQATWFPHSGPMRWTSGNPHSFGGRYVNRKKSPFAYDWEQTYGLNSLLYDPDKDFSALPSVFTSDGPTAYYYQSGPKLFACRLPGDRS